MTPQPRLSRVRQTGVMSDRAARLAEIEHLLADLRERQRPLFEERSRLVAEQAKEDWPDGPFTLVWWRYSAEQRDKYDDPMVALRAAAGIEDNGEGSTKAVEDNSGRTVYALNVLPWKPVVDGYPAVPEDVGW